MPAYLVSDIHLRVDRPDRAERFARWVERLSPDDTVTIAGDLCDFWFASRQRHLDPMACAGLRALKAFTARNGSISIMTGNHDVWLASFYEQTLEARVVREPFDLLTFGLRVHVVHGHLLGARSPWKAALESSAFVRCFGIVPGPLARGLESWLEQTNEYRRAESDRRHLQAYRRYADQVADQADLVVVGHIHRPRDDSAHQPRLIVLGGWIDGESYLRIDDSGATLTVGSDHLEPPASSADDR